MTDVQKTVFETVKEKYFDAYRKESMDEWARGTNPVSRFVGRLAEMLREDMFAGVGCGVTISGLGLLVGAVAGGPVAAVAGLVVGVLGWGGLLDVGSNLYKKVDKAAEKKIEADINSGVALQKLAMDEPVQFALMNDKVQKLAATFSAAAEGLPLPAEQKSITPAVDTPRTLKM
jgi:hypothetical protein